MREIKFRAWDKSKKVFIPTGVWAVVQTDFGAFGIMLKDWEDYREGEYFYEYAQELQQFTGLKDKNGKDIYEGDIDQDGGKVFYNTSMASFQIEYGEKADITDMQDVDTWMIISGNIYENPDLL